MKKFGKLTAIACAISMMISSMVAVKAEKELSVVSHGIVPIMGQAATWGTAAEATDGSFDTTYFVYGTSDGVATAQLDLGNSYEIDRVEFYMATGTIVDVLVANSSDFSDAEYMVNDGEKWVLDEGATTNSFRYVKAIPAAGVAGEATGNDDATPSVVYREIFVYAMTEVKEEEEVAAVVNVSHGIVPTMGQAATWGTAAEVTDGSFDTTYFVYGTSDGVATAQLDLGNRYEIDRIEFYMATGTIMDVLVANSFDFSDAEYLVNDGDKWVLDEGAVTNKFRYIKAIPAVGVAGEAAGNADATPSVVYREIFVYATEASAEEVRTMVNIAQGANIATFDVGGIIAGDLSYINDGNQASRTFFYGTGAEPAIRFEFPHAQPINKVDIINNEGWWGGGCGWTKTVLASNDPEFNDYVELQCGFRNTSGNGHNDYSSTWTLIDDTQKFRYVKVVFTPGPAHWANWASSGDTTPSFTVMEIDIMTTKASADLKNVSQDRPVTLQEGCTWYPGLDNPANLTNNMGQLIAANTGLATIELEYPMTIEQVELQLPYDIGRGLGYDIYLSNTATLTEDSVQILSSSVAQPAYICVTSVIPVETEEKFKYVLVGNPANFWILSGVRVLANDTFEGTEIEASFADGELTAGDTAKFNLSFRSMESIDKKVKIIIARYDEDILTDAKMSEVVTLSGTFGAETFEYEISEFDAINEDTQLKAFVWEVGENGGITASPFAGVAVKNFN